MARIITQSFRSRNSRLPKKIGFRRAQENSSPKPFIPRSAKLLAWAIFLVFFIENGTLGLIPRQFYFIYRNVRISDLLLYSLVIYSFFNIKEFIDLFSSRALIILKLFMAYVILQFIGSAFIYDYENPVEFFFRLKALWFTLMIFPFMLLVKRHGLGYLIKIIFPFAVFSNILYIISSITGIAMLPDIMIVKATLPGDLQVNRVFGGTFFGELYFLGYFYQWMTKKFKLYQLFFAVLFITPHILAFGRAAWVYLTFTILIMYIWNLLKKKNLKIIIRQLSISVIFVGALFYSFTKFVPESEYYKEAVGSRIEQGQEDVKYKKGTYGTRLLNINALLGLWLDNNILFGIGMHPMWVIKPETAEESIYRWGFSDIKWTSILAAYGLIGFLLAIIFQIYYIAVSLKLLKQNIKNDILTFFILMFLSQLLYDSFINYTYCLTTLGLTGLTSISTMYLTALIYKYEHPEKEYN